MAQIAGQRRWPRSPTTWSGSTKRPMPSLESRRHRSQGHARGPLQINRAHTMLEHEGESHLRLFVLRCRTHREGSPVSRNTRCFSSETIAEKLGKQEPSRRARRCPERPALRSRSWLVVLADCLGCRKASTCSGTRPSHGRIRGGPERPTTRPPSRSPPKPRGTSISTQEPSTVLTRMDRGRRRQPKSTLDSQQVTVSHRLRQLPSQPASTRSFMRSCGIDTERRLYETLPAWPRCGSRVPRASGSSRTAHPWQQESSRSQRPSARRSRS